MIQDNISIKTYYQHLRPIDKLFLVAILLISVDGTPIIPIDTNHRPLSIIVILFYWVLQKVKFLKIRLSAIDIKLFFIFGALWIFTLLKGILSYQDLKGLYKFTMTGGLSFITISSSLCFFQDMLKQHNPKGTIQIIAYTFLLSLILPIAIGVIQFLGIKEIIPYEIANKITLLFSYRPLGLSRIQMLNTEPAHAATYTVLVLLFVFFYYKGPKLSYFSILLSIIFLLLIISSSAAFVILLLTISLYFLLCTHISFKTLFQILFIGSLLLISGLFFLNYFSNEYTLSQIANLISIISDLSMDNVNSIIALNFSIYDRIFTPILGFLSLKSSYFLGMGGESFFYNYLGLIDQYFPAVSNNTIIIQTYVDEGQRATPKFLFSKIASEFGIIALVLFSSFIVRTFKKLILLKNNNEYLKGLCAIFIFAILSTVNTSYFNITFIIIITLCYSVIYYKNDTQLKTEVAIALL